MAGDDGELEMTLTSVGDPGPGPELAVGHGGDDGGQGHVFGPQRPHHGN